MTEISVIIPVRNEEGKISKCLDAVFRQTLKPKEVLVVDGHSTDRTVEIATRFHARVFFEEFRTRAGACNVGMENATGELIAFTDADCVPEESWLENLVKELQNGVVGVGGGIKNLGTNFWQRSINLALGTFVGSGNSVQGRFFKKRRYVSSISGCNSIYRKKDLLAIGGFDTNLTTAEDTELNRRLLKVGKLVYTPNAIVSHDHQRGLWRFGKRVYQYGYGRAKSKLWDVQIVPPLVIPLIVVSVLVNRWILPGALVVYIILTFAMGVALSIRERESKYLATIPVVYMVEHSAYAIGFWRGFLTPRARRRSKSDAM
jgi:glycosyltransferase involved in cell wall biosynthesis